MTSSFPKPSLELIVGDRERELKQNTYLDSDKAWAQYTKDTINANNEFAKQMYLSMTAAKKSRDKTIAGLSDWLPKTTTLINERLAANKRIQEVATAIDNMDRDGEAYKTLQLMISGSVDDQNDINTDNAIATEGVNLATKAFTSGHIQEAIGLMKGVSELKTHGEISEFFSNDQTIDGIIQIFSNIPLPVVINGETEYRILGDKDNTLDVERQLYTKIMAAYVANLKDSGALKRSYINREVIPAFYTKRKLYLVEKNTQEMQKVSDQLVKTNSEILVKGIKNSDGNPNYILNAIIAGDSEGKAKGGLMYMLNGPLKYAYVNGQISMEDIMYQLENSDQYNRNGTKGTLYEVYKDDVDKWKLEAVNERNTKINNEFKVLEVQGSDFVLDFMKAWPSQQRDLGVDSTEYLKWLDDQEIEFQSLYNRGFITNEVLNIYNNQKEIARQGPDDELSAVTLTRLLGISKEGGFITTNMTAKLNAADKKTLLEKHGDSLLSDDILNSADVSGVILKLYKPYFFGDGKNGSQAVDGLGRENAIRVGENLVAQEFKRIKEANPSYNDTKIIRLALNEFIKDWRALSPEKQLDRVLTDSGIFASGRTLEQSSAIETKIIDVINQIPTKPSILLSEDRIGGEDDQTITNLENYLKGKGAVPDVYARYGAALNNSDPRNIAIARALSLKLITTAEAKELQLTGDFFKTALGSKLYEEMTKHPLAGNFFELSNGGDTLKFATEAFIKKSVLEDNRFIGDDKFNYYKSDKDITLDKPINEYSVGQIKELFKQGKISEVGIFGLDEQEFLYATALDVLGIEDLNTVKFDADFQKKLPGLLMKAQCASKHLIAGSEVPKTCKTIELNYESDLLEGEVLLQVLNELGEVDTTHFSNQPANLSAAMMEELIKDLRD